MSVKNLLKAILNALIKTYGSEKAFKLLGELAKIISR